MKIHACCLLTTTKIALYKSENFSTKLFLLNYDTVNLVSVTLTKFLFCCEFYLGFICICLSWYHTTQTPTLLHKHAYISFSINLILGLLPIYRWFIMIVSYGYHRCGEMIFSYFLLFFMKKNSELREEKISTINK